MKKYIVYGENENGNVYIYKCFAQSKYDAERRIKENFREVVHATAFDYVHSIYECLRINRK